MGQSRFLHEAVEEHGLAQLDLEIRQARVPEALHRQRDDLRVRRRIGGAHELHTRLGFLTQHGHRVALIRRRRLHVAQPQRQGMLLQPTCRQSHRRDRRVRADSQHPSPGVEGLPYLFRPIAEGGVVQRIVQFQDGRLDLLIPAQAEALPQLLLKLPLAEALARECILHPVGNL